MSPDEALEGESTTSRSDGEGDPPVAEEGRKRRRRTRARSAKLVDEPQTADPAPPSRLRRRSRKRSAKPEEAAEAESPVPEKPGSEKPGSEKPGSEKPARSRRRTRSRARASDPAPERPDPEQRDPEQRDPEGEAPEGAAAEGAKPSRSRRRPRRRRARSAPEAQAERGERGDDEGDDRRPPEASAEASTEAPAEAPRRGRRKKGGARPRKREPAPVDAAEEGPEEIVDRDAEPEDVERAKTPETPAEPVEKILLVNAVDPEEVRIVLLENGQVEELYVEGIAERTATGNVYRGRVQNVEQAIGAAFVELGKSETGFLHVSDLPNREPGKSITDLIEPGQEVVVQITRDRIGKKGPALSGRISLAGRSLVLMANTDRSGVSRRIARGRQRDQARRLLSRLEPPEGMGLIIRTAGEGGGFEELKRDLDHLVSEWEALQARAEKPGAPGLLRAESDLAERSVRDIMPRDVTRIVTDREEVAARIRALLQAWYGPEDADPAGTERAEDGDESGAEGADEGDDTTGDEGGASAVPEVHVHDDAMPLFHAYGAEPQLEEAFRRVLRMPSGGSVVIDPTEALVSIDVNSGRSTEEKDPDATALQTNLEAVEVVARQLRLRDLGGLVVVDLIDMRERKNARAVERAFKKALARDRARIRVGRIGPFGCITLSRQRIRQALSRVTHEECPDCGGTGRRRHPEGLGLRVLREMRARVARARGRGGLEARVPKGVHDWIQRHRGRVLRDLEQACSGPVRLAVDDRLALDGWAMKGLPPGGGKARKS